MNHKGMGSVEVIMIVCLIMTIALIFRSKIIWLITWFFSM